MNPTSSVALPVTRSRASTGRAITALVHCETVFLGLVENNFQVIPGDIRIVDAQTGGLLANSVRLLSPDNKLVARIDMKEEGFYVATNTLTFRP